MASNPNSKTGQSYDASTSNYRYVSPFWKESRWSLCLGKLCSEALPRSPGVLQDGSHIPRWSRGRLRAIIFVVSTHSNMLGRAEFLNEISQFPFLDSKCRNVRRHPQGQRMLQISPITACDGGHTGCNKTWTGVKALLRQDVQPMTL